MKPAIAQLRSFLSRERTGWILYDWANSAYVLCVITVIGSAYFVGLFRSAAVRSGNLLVGGEPAMSVAGMVLPASAAWSFIVAGSALFVALTSPFLGAIADAVGARKRFLQTYCLVGVCATVALWFSLPWWAVGLLILLGNIAFEGGNVFYNAFLPDIAKPGQQDMVSSAGFAAGYLGGVIVLIFSLFVFILPSKDVHTPFLLIGLWWGGFAIVAFALLREAPGRSTVGAAAQAAFDAAAKAFDEGRFADAERGFRKASSIFPETELFIYNLGLALARQGKDDAARRELHKIANSPWGEAHPQVYLDLVALSAYHRPTAHTWLRRYVEAMEKAGKGDDPEVERSKRLLEGRQGDDE